MPCIKYQEKRFNRSSLKIIEQAIPIIASYEAQGFTLTLRQLYYQFVSRDLIKNKQTEYKRLGQIINDARLAGLIDWNSIEDRTRNLRGNGHWEDPAAIISGCANGYGIDLWEGQKYRPEVWIEKDALVGVIERVCSRLDVNYFACRGYSSQSEQWRAGRRLRRYAHDGQTPVVIHLGDHDPSGIDMTRDNDDRLSMFAAESFVWVKRVALNMDQIEQYGPPPNPAKMTDSRFEDYVSQFGEECWELDALEPKVIEDLIEREITELRDQAVYDEALARQERERAQLLALSENWSEVADFLETLE